MTHTFDDSIAEVRALHDREEAEARERDERLSAAFDPLCAAVYEALQPILFRMAEIGLPAVEKILDAVRDEYLAQGAIYGDNPQGLQRWIGELGEVDRHLMQAAYIHQRHQMLRDLKEKLDEANAT